MKDIYIRCMGCPSLQINGTPISFHRSKAFVLIAYLHITSRAYSRDELGAFFWPDLDSKKAKANLRNILSECRTILGPEVLKTDNRTVSPGSFEIKSDYSDFLRLAESRDLEDLQRASEIYREGFLKGIEISKAPQFDDWQFEIQQQLEVRYINLLEKLVSEAHKCKNISLEISWLRKLIHTNPLYEEYHRLLIQRFSESGDYNSAVHQYEILKKYLKEDGSGPPESETMKLIQIIRKGKKQKNRTQADSPDIEKNPKKRNSIPGKRTYIGIASICILIISIFLLLVIHPWLPSPQQKISIAVLPFDFLCDDDNAQKFAENFTIEMINSLAKETYISITPAQSVVKYKESILSVKQIADELDVEYIIDGSAMSFAECVRFSVQLIDISTDECIWTGSYNCDMDNSLKTQLEVILYLKTNIKESLKTAAFRDLPQI